MEILSATAATHILAHKPQPVNEKEVVGLCMVVPKLTSAGQGRCSAIVQLSPLAFVHPSLARMHFMSSVSDSVSRCRNLRSGRLAFSCLAIILTNQPFSTATPAEIEPGRYALLIGINEYVSPEISDLRGAVNDVNMISRILVTRFGFDEKDVAVIVDQKATRAGILNAIDQFIARVGPNDAAYFHFSGHGSRIEDFSGDETDGIDETIIPHDARQAGIPDILDDELDQRFDRLRAKHALIIFDSCNSGTVTRSASVVQVRTVPPDTRLDLYRAASHRTRQVIEVRELPHVLMTSAPADRDALDGPIDNAFYGLFSYALARSLDANGPDATPIAIHDGVKNELSRIREQLFTAPPEPQLEAPADRLLQPALPLARNTERHDVSIIARRAWLSAEPMANGNLLLRDGQALNATPGSQWGIYGPDEIAFSYGEALALGTIDSLSGNDSILKPQIRRATIPPGARAISIAPPDLSGSLPLQLTGVADRRRTPLIQTIRTRLPGAEIVGPTEFARFILEYRDNQWHVMDAGGLQQVLAFADGPDAMVAERLVSVLSRASKAMALLALDNPASDLRLSVRLRTAESRNPITERRGLVRVPNNPEPTYRIRRPGEARNSENSLIIEVQADRNVYLTIASVDTTGSVNLLFPNRYQKPGFMPEGFLSANTRARVPDSLASGNRAGFHWDYGPPAGTDTIRVFASVDLATADTMRRFISGAANDPSGFRELRTKLTATAVRGLIRVADDATADITQPVPATGPWSATSLVIRVRD
jgi:hypothetical protein